MQCLASELCLVLGLRTILGYAVSGVAGLRRLTQGINDETTNSIGVSVQDLPPYASNVIKQQMLSPYGGRSYFMADNNSISSNSHNNADKTSCKL